jgi:hypothetical protein
MACATPVGAASPPAFGIAAEELGLKTQSVKVSLKSDIAELRDSCGNVVNAAFYNRQNDATIEGYGISGGTKDDVSDTVTLANAAVFTGSLLVGTLFITQIDTELTNTGFVKTTVTAKSWESAHA